MDAVTLVLLAIIVASWVLYYGYWAVQARGAAAADEVAASGGNLWWLAVQVGLFVVLAVFGYRIHAGATVLRPIGTVLTVVGVAISVWARRTLAANWSKDVAIVRDQEIVTAGPYAAVRHPIYSAYVLMLVGTALFFLSVGLLVLVVALAAFLVVKARREEVLLAERMPAVYEPYRQRTKAFVPGIW